MFCHPTVLFHAPPVVDSVAELPSSEFYELSEGMGNLVNGMFGISPPTVAEYLYSANNNLLIALIGLDVEEDFFGEEGNHNRLYYHLP
jgi:hypothetical protein